MIVCADLHLRDDVPTCRLENQQEWHDHQINCIRFIVDRCLKTNSGLYIVGDLFHRPIVSFHLFNRMIDEFKRLQKKYLHLHIMPGNHDKEYENLSNCTSIETLYKFDMTLELYDRWRNPSNIHFKFVHELVWEKTKPEKAKGIIATDLIKKFPDCDYIFTGDNHKSFIYKEGRTIVANCGCVNRQSSNLVEYNPSIFFLDTHYNLERIYVPDNEIVETKLKTKSVELEIGKAKTFDYKEYVNSLVVNKDAEIRNYVKNKLEVNNGKI